jgi:GNAT superfamily N-acetyltransferase
VDVRIARLFDSPEHRATVARWIYDEWWADKDRYTPEALEDLLRQAVCLDAIPLCLLALVADEPVGTINLVENDDDSRPHLRPWLAALFVRPSWRRQGIGTLLVRSLQEQARRLRVDGMYLGTDKPDFYARIGATIHERLDQGFCIMYLPWDGNGVTSILMPRAPAL